MKLQARRFLEHPSFQFIALNVVLLIATEVISCASKRIWVLKNNKPVVEAEEVKVEER